MDKFGSNSRDCVSFRRMRQDLVTNTKRISSLENPKDRSDAVTKPGMTQQLKDGITNKNEVKAAIEVISKRLNGIEKGVARFLRSTWERVNDEIDMWRHPITNLPTLKSADEPVTKGWYADNLQELLMRLTGKINISKRRLREKGHGASLMLCLKRLITLIGLRNSGGNLNSIPS